MDERLNNLKDSLGVDWGHLAERLGISRSMLGFIRRGNKKPSKRLLIRIMELEASAGSNELPKVASNHASINWVQQLSELEARMARVERLLVEVLDKLSSK